MAFRSTAEKCFGEPNDGGGKPQIAKIAESPDQFADVYSPFWGISLDQLSDLVVRLRSFYAERLEDFSIKTMRDVVADFIEKETRGTGMGYALGRNERRPLRATVMISHCWDENADAFFDAIRKRSDKIESLKDSRVQPTRTRSNRRMSASRSISDKRSGAVPPPPGIWICALANFQQTAGDTSGPSIGDQLGKKVMKGPFFQVVASADLMMVVQTHEAAVYTRMWCLLELFVSMQSNTEVELIGEWQLDKKALDDFDPSKASCGPPFDCPGDYVVSHDQLTIEDDLAGGGVVKDRLPKGTTMKVLRLENLKGTKTTRALVQYGSGEDSGGSYAIEGMWNHYIGTYRIDRHRDGHGFKYHVVHRCMRVLDPTSTCVSNSYGDLYFHGNLVVLGVEVSGIYKEVAEIVNHGKPVWMKDGDPSSRIQFSKARDCWTIAVDSCTYYAAFGCRSDWLPWQACWQACGTEVSAKPVTMQPQDVLQVADAGHTFSNGVYRQQPDGRYTKDGDDSYYIQVEPALNGGTRWVLHHHHALYCSTPHEDADHPASVDGNLAWQVHTTDQGWEPAPKVTKQGWLAEGDVFDQLGRVLGRMRFRPGQKTNTLESQFRQHRRLDWDKPMLADRAMGWSTLTHIDLRKSRRLDEDAPLQRFAIKLINNDEKDIRDNIVTQLGEGIEEAERWGTSGLVARPGSVLDQYGVACVASFPGRCAEIWNDISGKHVFSSACVFLHHVAKTSLGNHVSDGDGGACLCPAIYGHRSWDQFGYLLVERIGCTEQERKDLAVTAQAMRAVIVQEGSSARVLHQKRQEAEEAWIKCGKVAAWGCKWFADWKANIDLARRRGQELHVYFFPKAKVGDGKVKWHQLPNANLWDGLGLGPSQKCEVAYLDRMGYDYKELSVVDFLDMYGGREDATERAWRKMKERISEGVNELLVQKCEVGRWLHRHRLSLGLKSNTVVADIVEAIMKAGFLDISTLSRAKQDEKKSALQCAGLNASQIETLLQDLREFTLASSGLGTWLKKKLHAFHRLASVDADGEVAKYLQRLSEQGVKDMSSLLALDEGALNRILARAGFDTNARATLIREIALVKDANLGGATSGKIMQLSLDKFLPLVCIVTADVRSKDSLNNETAENAAPPTSLTLLDKAGQVHAVDTSRFLRKDVEEWVQSKKTWQLQLSTAQNQVVAVPSFVEFKNRTQIFLVVEEYTLRIERSEWAAFLLDKTKQHIRSRLTSFWFGVALVMGGAALREENFEAELQEELLSNQHSVSRSVVQKLCMGPSSIAMEVRFFSSRRRRPSGVQHDEHQIELGEACFTEGVKHADWTPEYGYELRPFGADHSVPTTTVWKENVESLFDVLCSTVTATSSTDAMRSWECCHFESGDLHEICAKGALRQGSLQALCSVKMSLVDEQHRLWHIVLELSAMLLDRELEQEITLDTTKPEEWCTCPDLGALDVKGNALVNHDGEYRQSNGAAKWCKELGVLLVKHTGLFVQGLMVRKVGKTGTVRCFKKVNEDKLYQIQKGTIIVKVGTVRGDVDAMLSSCCAPCKELALLVHKPSELALQQSTARPKIIKRASTENLFVRVDANQKIRSIVAHKDLAELRRLLPFVTDDAVLYLALKSACWQQWGYHTRNQQVSALLHVKQLETDLRTCLDTGDITGLQDLMLKVQYDKGNDKYSLLRVKSFMITLAERGGDLSGGPCSMAVSKVPPLGLEFAEGHAHPLLNQEDEEVANLEIVGFARPWVQRYPFKKRDRLLAVGGVSVSNLQELESALACHGIGAEIPVVIQKAYRDLDYELLSEAKERLRYKDIELAIREAIAGHERLPLEALVAQDEHLWGPDGTVWKQEVRVALQVVECENILRGAITTKDVGQLLVHVKRAERFKGRLVGCSQLTEGRVEILWMESSAVRRTGDEVHIIVGLTALTGRTEDTGFVRGEVKDIKTAERLGIFKLRPAREVDGLLLQDAGDLLDHMLEVSSKPGSHRHLNLLRVHNDARGACRFLARIVRTTAQNKQDLQSQAHGAQAPSSCASAAVRHSSEVWAKFGELEIRKLNLGHTPDKASKVLKTRGVRMIGYDRQDSMLCEKSTSPPSEDYAAFFGSDDDFADDDKIGDTEPDLVVWSCSYRMGLQNASVEEDTSDGIADTGCYSAICDADRVVMGVADLARCVGGTQARDQLAVNSFLGGDFIMELKCPELAKVEQTIVSMASASTTNLATTSGTTVAARSASRFQPDARIKHEESFLTLMSQSTSRSTLAASHLSTSNVSPQCLQRMGNMRSIEGLEDICQVGILHSKKTFSLPTVRPWATPRGPKTLKPLSYSPRTPRLLPLLSAEMTGASLILRSCGSLFGETLLSNGTSTESQRVHDIKCGEVCELIAKIFPLQVTDLEEKFGSDTIEGFVALVPARKFQTGDSYDKPLAVALSTVNLGHLAKSGVVAEVSLIVPDMSVEQAEQYGLCELRLCAVGLEPRVVSDGVRVVPGEACSQNFGRRFHVHDEAMRGLPLLTSSARPLRRSVTLGSVIMCKLQASASIKQLKRDVVDTLTSGDDLMGRVGACFGQEAVELARRIDPNSLEECAVVTVARAEVPRVQLALLYPGISGDKFPPLCTKRPVVTNAQYGNRQDDRAGVGVVKLGVIPILSFEHLPGCHQYVVECSLVQSPPLSQHSGRSVVRTWCFTVDVPDHVEGVASRSQEALSLTCDLQGLVQGRYRCRVKAKNTNGYGVWSLHSRAFGVLDEAFMLHVTKQLEVGVARGDPMYLAAVVAKADRIHLNSRILDHAKDMVTKQLQRSIREADRLHSVLPGRSSSTRGEESAAEVNKQLVVARDQLQWALAYGHLTDLVAAVEQAKEHDGFDTYLLSRGEKRLKELVYETRVLYAIDRHDEEALKQALDLAQDAGVPMRDKIENAYMAMRIARMRSALMNGIRQESDVDKLVALMQDAQCDGDELKAEVKALDLKVQVLRLHEKLQDISASENIDSLQQVLADAESLTKRARNDKLLADEGIDFAYIEQRCQTLRLHEQAGYFRSAIEKSTSNDCTEEVLKELQGAMKLGVVDEFMVQQVKTWLARKGIQVVDGCDVPELLFHCAMASEDNAGLTQLLSDEAMEAKPSLLRAARSRNEAVENEKRLSKAVLLGDEEVLRLTLEDSSHQSPSRREAERLLAKISSERRLRVLAEDAEGLIASNFQKQHYTRVQEVVSEIAEELEKSAAYGAGVVSQEFVDRAHSASVALELRMYQLILDSGKADANENLLYDLMLLTQDHLVTIRRDAAAELCRMHLARAVAGSDTAALASALSEAEALMVQSGLCQADDDMTMIRSAADMMNVVACRGILSRALQQDDREKLEEGLSHVSQMSTTDETIRQLSQQAYRRVHELVVLQALQTEELETVSKVRDQIAVGDLTVSQHVSQQVNDKFIQLELLSHVQAALQLQDLQALKSLVDRAHECKLEHHPRVEEAQEYLLASVLDKLKIFQDGADVGAGAEEVPPSVHIDNDKSEAGVDFDDEGGGENVSDTGVQDKPVDQGCISGTGEWDEHAAQDALLLASGVRGIDVALLDRVCNMYRTNSEQQLLNAMRSDNLQGLQSHILRLERLAPHGISGASDTLVNSAKERLQALHCKDSLCCALKTQQLDSLKQALQVADRLGCISPDLVNEGRRAVKVLECKLRLRCLQTVDELHSAIDEAEELGLEAEEVRQAKEHLESVRTRENQQRQDREVQERREAKQFAKELRAKVQGFVAARGQQQEKELHELVKCGERFAGRLPELDELMSNAREVLSDRACR